MTASEAGLPRLVFLLADAACPPGASDSDRAAVTGFRRRLKEAGVIVRFFSSGEGLELEVFHALKELADGVPLRGLAESVPGIWNLPGRNADFTGRTAVLQRLHEDLSAEGRAVVLPRALYGMGGVGKTQTALEYAHRFQGDYDLVWWIAAEQSQAITLALANLAARLGLQVGEDASDAAGVALEHLRRDAAGRWLIIFDNAEDPAVLAPYFPAGAGHVIVTSRNHAWTRFAEPVEVDVFSNDEAVAHLMRHVPRLTAGDAAKIATTLGELPLAVEQAAAWLSEAGMPADMYTELLETQLSSAQGLDDPYWEPLVATFGLSLSRLRDRSPAAVWLLRILAFCSPDSISMTLLFGEEMTAALLSFDKALREKFALGRTIRDISRLALVKVDQGSNSLQIHRLVQAVIRAQMTEDEQAHARHDLHKILVGARPEQGETDDPANWSTYEFIWPHLGPAEAEKCDDPRTRQLLLDWVRYQWKVGEYEACLNLANRLEETWSRQLGADDQQTLLLRFHVANVMRSQGRFGEARDLDMAVLNRQLQGLGIDHPHTLMTAGGLAADYRALGDFWTALTSDKQTYASFKEQFGEGYPRTLSAANNLATSYRLNGDYAAARRLDEDTLEGRRLILPPDHPDTLFSAAMLALDMRAEGAFRHSADLLRATLDKYRAVFGIDMLPSLRAATSLAVSLLEAGEQSEAMRLAQDTYNRYRRRYRPTDPDALSCALSLAGIHSAADENGRALELAAEVRAAYQSSLGSGHPGTLAAANNLAIYLRCTGDFVQALKLAEDTLEKMRIALGRDHPSSLACAINLAACLGETGSISQAESLQRETAQNLRNRLSAWHPYVLACDAGLAVTLHRVGQYKEADKIRAAILDIFARDYGNHPAADMLRNWQYLSRNLESPQF